MGRKTGWAKWMQTWGAALGMAWQRLLCGLANSRRRMLRKRLAEYPVFVLDHQISERAPDAPWWYAFVPNLKLPLSLEHLADAFQRVAADPDIKGIVLLLKGPGLSLAQAQSLSLLFERFRAWDQHYCGVGGNAPVVRKQVIVHLEQSSIPVYVAACAADRILMTPLASWDVVGLRVVPTYLKETLAHAGIEMDVVKIAPWKTAVDTLTRASMSEAEREQTNWLLDSLCDDIVQAISRGRRLPIEQVTALINRAPLTAQEAQAAGLVDDLAYEDELPRLLGQPANTPQAANASKNQERKNKERKDEARLKPYARVRPLLMRRPQRRHAGAVGVLSLQGNIIVGSSRTSPIPLPILGDRMMGSHTVEQQIRAVRRNPGLAAVVVHVDSGGGSALASDLMWRELKLLDREKPVVVYMGNVAASGGYYLAAAGRKVVAQSATLTGSIGVVTAKPVTAGLFEKLDAHREVIERGANAGLYAPDQGWVGPQRDKVEEGVLAVYNTFKQRVAEGRRLPFEELDAIANGRVWTGKQALGHNLVDALGDFQVALDLACQMADLPTDGSVRTEMITPPKTRLLAEPASAMQMLLGQPWRQSLWTQDVKLAVMAALTGDRSALLGSERYWLIADGLPMI